MPRINFAFGDDIIELNWSIGGYTIKANQFFLHLTFFAIDAVVAIRSSDHET